MKKCILLLSSVFLSIVMFAQTPAALSPDDVSKMNQEKHDFGKLKQGVPAVFNFEIKNTSKKPIVVESATASCGCTVPETPQGPIAPGSVGKIKVSYNSASIGAFTKEVTIKLAGIDLYKKVQITGEVLDPATYDEYAKTKPKK